MDQHAAWLLPVIRSTLCASRGGSASQTGSQSASSRAAQRAACRWLPTGMCRTGRRLQYVLAQVCCPPQCGLKRGFPLSPGCRVLFSRPACCKNGFYICCHAAYAVKDGQDIDQAQLAGEEKEGEELCTVGRDESAPVTLTCNEGYMLQVCYALIVLAV